MQPLFTVVETGFLGYTSEVKVEIHPKDRELLREFAKGHSNATMSNLDVDRLDELKVSQIDIVIRCIADELQTKGFGPDRNPTPRGYDMERLIDVMTRVRIARLSVPERFG
jgi:hypothetical protein